MRALLTIALGLLLPACIANGTPEPPAHRASHDSGGELVDDEGVFEDDAGDDDAGDDDTDPADPVDPGSDPPPDEDPYTEDPAPDPGTPPPTCADNKKLCTDRCVNVLRDRDNCGGCGRVCSSNATGCYDGRCTCGAGHHLCGLSCVNLQANESHCGSCDHACPGAKKCCNGTCKSSC